MMLGRMPEYCTVPAESVESLRPNSSTLAKSGISMKTTAVTHAQAALAGGLQVVPPPGLSTIYNS
jgi:hypothetical protein